MPPMFDMDFIVTVCSKEASVCDDVSGRGSESSGASTQLPHRRCSRLSGNNNYNNSNVHLYRAH